ncbi:MAG: tRNA 4-thiouridine(8) synthase ThiI, partial [Methanosarcinaceae archaeon]|nr:tRNA 4-thiouridine(8) synthase ThiI [Methanosarcinaceae archaeon]
MLPAENTLIVRYGELSLKSKGVRDIYEETLRNNIRAMMDSRHVSYKDVRRDYGRIFVDAEEGAGNIGEIAEAVSRVFGVFSVSPAAVCRSSKEEITALCAEIAAAGYIGAGETFAVRARRTGNHPFTSNEMARFCGDAIWRALSEKGLEPAVDLTSPDKEIFVEIRQKESFVYTKIIKGPGGFPVGTQGKMVALISGGIDSPVAVWLMMKRGVDVVPVFMDNTPYADPDTISRVLDNARVLFSWAPGRRHVVYSVPHAEYMEKVIENCHLKSRCLLCKRSMFKAADCIRRRIKASGIITGSSLGQVASQTAANMEAEIYGLSMPLYHPLLSYDKQEIVDIARMIGTYDISTRPSGPDCTIVPEKPEVKAAFDLAVREEALVGEEILDEM